MKPITEPSEKELERLLRSFLALRPDDQVTFCKFYELTEHGDPVTKGAIDKFNNSHLTRAQFLDTVKINISFLSKVNHWTTLYNSV